LGVPLQVEEGTWFIFCPKELATYVYCSHYHKCTPVPKTGQGVFQTELYVLHFHPVDMHTPTPKIEEDFEFPNVLTAKQLSEKA
jgi:hypothetical protein